MKQPKEGQMPKFLLKISEDPIEFEAPTADATGVASLSGSILLRHSLPT